MELRATTEGDLPALHAAFSAAIASVFVPHGFDPPAPPLAGFSLLQSHIARTGLSILAEEDGVVLGFGASWTRGEDWYLASLFVAPAAQGRGVGSALLDAVWGTAARRRTMTDAIQPVSNVLYGRRGLIPATPVLTFFGAPRIEAAGEPDGGGDVRAIDLAAHGFDRSVDHAFWERFAPRTMWSDAYAYALPGHIGPVAGLTPEAAARALAYELARAETELRVRVPGSARELVAVALRAGLRLDPVPGLLLLSDGVAAPTALAPSGYTLF